MGMIKPDDLEYFGVHNWLSYHYGKANCCENKLCESVSPKRYEWALIKGKNIVRNRNNFMMLCPSCHRKYDFTEEQRAKQRKAAIGRTFSELTLEKISQAGKNKGIKSVFQKTKDGTIIKEFDSIKNAVIATGISQSRISNVLTQRNETAGGFIWQYKHVN